MNINTKEDVLKAIEANNVKFIRLQFTDIQGVVKDVEIPVTQVEKALGSGISFDGRGNYTLGIREQIIFPEINYDKIDKIRGMNITIVTSAITDEEAKGFLKYLGMPFKN